MRGKYFTHKTIGIPPPFALIIVLLLLGLTIYCFYSEWVIRADRRSLYISVPTGIILLILVLFIAVQLIKRPNIIWLKSTKNINELINALGYRNESNVRKNAANALCSLGWMPRGDRERGLLALAREDFEDAAKYGVLAKVCIIRDGDWKIIAENWNEPSIEELAELFPPEMIAGKDKADVIIKVSWEYKAVGRYSNNITSAYTVNCTVTITDRRKWRLPIIRQIRGSEPPSSIIVGHNVKTKNYGYFPIETLRGQLSEFFGIYISDISKSKVDK
jgi:hypothetical protein